MIIGLLDTKRTSLMSYDFLKLLSLLMFGSKAIVPFWTRDIELDVQVLFDV